MLKTTVLLCALLGPGIAFASSEVPLSWETVSVRIQERGAFEVTASRSRDGYLEALTVTIRGVPIEIPRSCLPSNNSVYLNDLSISYGEFEDGVPYWHLQMGVDDATSHNGVGKYHLVLLEDEAKLGYIERAESDTVFVDDPPICGSWH